MLLHLLGSEREDKTRLKRGTARENRGRIGFAFVFCVRGLQIPEDPQFEHHG